jgi:serine/threonine protein kinase
MTFQQMLDDLIRRLDADKPADLTELVRDRPQYKAYLLQAVQNWNAWHGLAQTPTIDDRRQKARHLITTQPEFDGYRLDRILGEGGAAVVYAAHEIFGGRKVALKVFFACSAEEQLTKEYECLRALAKVDTVPTVLRCNRIDGLLYVVMDLVEGQTLAAKMKDTAPQHLRRHLGDVLVGVCEALDEVARYSRLGQKSPKALQFVHGDIKPSNIMIQGDFQRTVVLDFSISRLVKPCVGGGTAGTNDVAGFTRMYAAPEVLCGECSTVASDLFQLGAIGYEIATGKAYWAVPSGTRLRRLRTSKISSRHKSILKKALAWDVERRFQQAAEMLAALRKA